jgi:hypothetical protein
LTTDKIQIDVKRIDARPPNIRYTPFAMSHFLSQKARH